MLGGGGGGGGGGGQGECERRSEAFVKIQNIFLFFLGGGAGTGRIWGVRVDVNEEVTFFVIYLFIFWGGRGESDQMFGWGRGGGGG